MGVRGWVCAVAALALCVSVFGSFNCNRDRSQCQNGSECDFSTGDCICTNGTIGYDCSVFDANTNDTACDGFCANGGTCHLVAGTPTCLCPVEFMGTNCTDQRYMVICEADNMTLEIIPFVPTFSGSVFVVDQQGQADCTAGDGGSGVQTLTVSHDNATCGNAEIDPLLGVTQRCFYIIYNNNTLTSRDQKVCAVCGDGDTITKTAGNFTVTDVDNNLDTRTIGSAPVDSDVGISLSASGVEVTGSVTLGDELEIMVHLTQQGMQRFPAIRLEQCEATNGLDRADVLFNSGNLIENSCPSPDMELVLMDDLNRTMDNFNVSFSFSAFKFINGDRVVISCTIRPCPILSECDPVACSPGESPARGYGRRKRQAGDNPADRKVLSRSYTIGIPEPITRDRTEVTKIITKECEENTEMTAVVIALSGALFLLLLLLLVLLIRALLRRRSDTCSDKHQVDERFTHLPKIVPAKNQ